MILVINDWKTACNGLFFDLISKNIPRKNPSENLRFNKNGSSLGCVE